MAWRYAPSMYERNNLHFENMWRNEALKRLSIMNAILFIGVMTHCGGTSHLHIFSMLEIGWAVHLREAYRLA